MKRSTALSYILAVIVSAYASLSAQDRPNVLWLTFEDTSADEFGCYGGKDAKTPTVDRLAKRGIQFMNAWSTAPHCSPARSTLITGSYATTYGMDNHRHKWKTPKDIFYPQLIRKAGYFCTNNKKTDYNTTVDHKAMWDECGKTATYKSAARKKDQPFFAIFNATITHMSRLTSVTLEGRRDFSKEGLAPEMLNLPPHVADLPGMRSDLAFHLEGVQDIDRWVGLHLAELKKQGLDKNTIIFFYSDHGGCLPRGKGFPHDSGLRVPMLVYLPPKYQHLSKLKPGTKSDRLVGFVDLAPTLLSLIGQKPPKRMQGRAFMGPNKQKPRTLQFGFRTNNAQHYDPCRTVTDGRYKYTRHYIPNKQFCLRNSFQWQMPSNLEWDAYAIRIMSGQKEDANPKWLQPFGYKPAEVLFDLKTDPYELNNLADDPKHAETLKALRAAVSEHIRKTGDLGFFPRATKLELKTGLFDWVKSKEYDLKPLHDIAERASMPNEKDVPYFTECLKSPRSEIRFWAVRGLGMMGACPEQVQNAAANDSNPQVAASAALACVYGGFDELGIKAILKGLENEKVPYFRSSLETLSWDPKYRPLLRKHSDDIKNACPRSAKTLAINLGQSPVQSLYGKQLIKRKIDSVNKHRRPLAPLP